MKPGPKRAEVRPHSLLSHRSPIHLIPSPCWRAMESASEMGRSSRRIAEEKPNLRAWVLASLQVMIYQNSGNFRVSTLMTSFRKIHPTDSGAKDSRFAVTPTSPFFDYFPLSFTYESTLRLPGLSLGFARDGEPAEPKARACSGLTLSGAVRQSSRP